ncbi:MAG: serine hydrolase [Bacteroidetes bacterium]|nr:serine hydrolase [Bacteroidota bacterium]
MVFIFLQTNIAIFAQTKNDNIDTLIQSYVSLNKFSGNVLIAKEGKVIFEKSYGFADRDFDIPNSQNTKFRITSLAKQFTAVLILQLANQVNST